MTPLWPWILFSDSSTSDCQEQKYHYELWTLLVKTSKSQLKCPPFCLLWLVFRRRCHGTRDPLRVVGNFSEPPIRKAAVSIKWACVLETCSNTAGREEQERGLMKEKAKEISAQFISDFVRILALRFSFFLYILENMWWLGVNYDGGSSEWFEWTDKSQRWANL